MTKEGGHGAKKVMLLAQIFDVLFFCNSLNLFFLNSHEALIILERATRKTHSVSEMTI